MTDSLAVLLGLPDGEMFGAPRANAIDVADIGLLIALLIVLGSLLRARLVQARVR
ncbi:MAG: hypothetical protein NW223_13785 [Hyphomicrobiaceae bacterium]|nr:hypothetical protein [Hyphomicrobiaceae bacterium]